MDMVAGPVKDAQYLRTIMKMTQKLFAAAHISPVSPYYWYVVINKFRYTYIYMCVLSTYVHMYIHTK